MAKTTTPAFSQNAKFPIVQAGTANTNLDGSTGTYTSSVAAGANDSYVDYVKFQAVTATVAGRLAIFFSADNSTNWRCIGTVLTGTVTPSGTVKPDEQIWVPPGGVPLHFPAGAGLKFATYNGSETWNCIVHQADF